MITADEIKKILLKHLVGSNPDESGESTYFTTSRTGLSMLIEDLDELMAQEFQAGQDYERADRLNR